MGYKLDKSAREVGYEAVAETLKEMSMENKVVYQTETAKEYMSNEEADKLLQEALGDTFKEMEYEARITEILLEHSAWRAKACSIAVVAAIGMYCLGMLVGFWLWQH